MIKIGNNTPDSIITNKAIIHHKRNLFDYFKYANDGDGYFVHGLWLAPTFISDGRLYWWPWDLGVPGGALKDVNNGYARWGYVQDGSNKNITGSQTYKFNKGDKENWGVAITVFFNTPNYTDDTGSYLDLEVPIVITFNDDRFDSYNWITSPGAIYEWSEDKRTITIHRIPSSTHTVCYSSNEDKSYDKCTDDLKDVYANVTGLSANYEDFYYGDPSTQEIWDVYMSNSLIYHKDKTLDNCWKEYKLASEKVVNGVTVVSVANSNEEIDKVILPDIIDLQDNLRVKDSNGNLTKYIRWNITLYNKEFWDSIRQWYSDNKVSLEEASSGLFNNSNVNGAITLNISSELTPSGNMVYADLPSIIEGTNIENITINFENIILNSNLNLFKGAGALKELTINTPNNTPLKAIECAGMFEWCGSLTTYPANLIRWSDRAYSPYYPQTVTNISYFAEGAGFETIPIYGTDRTSNDNTIIASAVGQAFHWCPCKYIGPVIDLKYIHPEKSVHTNGFVFDCTNLEDARIRNLNHGDWTLDGTANSKGFTGGNLPNLNEESIKYLFDNLCDLTIHNTVELSPASTFENNFWHNRNNNVGSNDWRSMTLTNNNGKAYATTNIPFENMNITVRGLTEGSRLEFGSGDIASSENSITSDGTYTINKTSTIEEGFKLYSSNPNVEVIIRLNDYYHPEFPTIDTANLKCPSTWKSKVTDTMVEAANAKGWKIYFGGTLYEI